MNQNLYVKRAFRLSVSDTFQKLWANDRDKCGYFVIKLKTFILGNGCDFDIKFVEHPTRRKNIFNILNIYDLHEYLDRQTP